MHRHTPRSVLWVGWTLGTWDWPGTTHMYIMIARIAHHVQEMDEETRVEMERGAYINSGFLPRRSEIISAAFYLLRLILACVILSATTTSRAQWLLSLSRSCQSVSRRSGRHRGYCAAPIRHHLALQFKRGKTDAGRKDNLGRRTFSKKKMLGHYSMYVVNPRSSHAVEPLSVPGIHEGSASRRWSASGRALVATLVRIPGQEAEVSEPSRRYI
jgi:hypothetical protein